MEKIIECIPNFSEGRRKNVMDAIIGEIRSTPGVTIWFSSSDEDYNRLCTGFIGSPEAVSEAMIKAAEKASEYIDMRSHKGAHPRVGATDVVPFVPIQNISVEECVAVADQVAKTLADKLHIPVYLYNLAAKSPSRPTQQQIQSTQYERMFDKIHEPGFGPDYGPSDMNPLLGATMVGVRGQVISVNFTLASDDLHIAKKIAASVRESSGGLKNIKAIGVKLDNGLVQVSMDDGDYKKTPLYKPFELVKAEAQRYGTYVKETELIGMIPNDALTDLAAHYIRLWPGFNQDQIVENKLFAYISERKE